MRNLTVMQPAVIDAEGWTPAMPDPRVIDALDALERYARAFDEISDEQDARYSAWSFVRWVWLGDDGPTRGRASDRCEGRGRVGFPYPNPYPNLYP